jgi:hypothetical protein
MKCSPAKLEVKIMVFDESVKEVDVSLGEESKRVVVECK